MKSYKLSFAAANEHVPAHPERTAKCRHGGLDFDVTFKVWPNRASMLKTIEMQRKRADSTWTGELVTDWKPCQP